MLRILLAGATFACLFADGAHTQEGYPNQPVRIVVPVAAGGGVDTIARIYALHMSKVMGQQFYVENRAGAGNIIGSKPSPAHPPTATRC